MIAVAHVWNQRCTRMLEHSAALLFRMHWGRLHIFQSNITLLSHFCLEEHIKLIVCLARRLTSKALTNVSR